MIAAKQYIGLFALLLVFAQCVPQKKYEALNQRYNGLDSLYRVTQASNVLLNRKVTSLQDDTAQCNREVRILINQFDQLVQESDGQVKQLQQTVTSLDSQLVNYSLFTGDTVYKASDIQVYLTYCDSVNLLLKQSLDSACAVFMAEELLFIRPDNGQLRIALTEELLFREGSRTLLPSGKAALDSIASSLLDFPQINLQVNGHTDSLPLRGNRYKDNWDFSVLRATTVIYHLTKESGLPNERFIAMGHASNIPVYPNNTPSGREQNRRIEIILSPTPQAWQSILDNQ